jgi:hypothetical protein
MSVSRQVDILNKIVSIMHSSADPGYSSMRCEFEYDPGEGAWSAGAKFSYLINGRVISEHLSSAGVAYELLHDLHEVMKSHSGGDWRSLVVDLGEDGKVNTRFSY